MTEARGKIDILLLAAGLSTRMGSANKLLLDFGGQPLVRHTASVLSQCGFESLTVVTGFDARAIGNALRGLPLSLSVNPDFESGQMGSVAHGLRTIRASHPGAPRNVMICLADMPYLQKADYQALADAFFSRGGNRIAVPEYAGQRGNPIILPAHLIDEATGGGLNTGCRRLIDNRPEDVDRIRIDNSAFVRDIDTPPDYDNALRDAFPGAPCCM
ncbi:MAG: nucleotidyltransferase family protein [Alphaproteobacteria bacterium]|nr:nucleotidyltransferase family protein [Alphaproteobacteria bacterium]